MRRVVISFATTGVSPKKGHRMSELVAIECKENEVKGRVLHLCFKVDGVQSANKSFAEQFHLLDEMIGSAKVVVLDRVIWRRFLRNEISGVKNRSARRLLKDAIDILTWARQKFPRQRKDVKSIARLLQIKVGERLGDVRQEAEVLFLIASQMNCYPSDLITSSVDLIESEYQENRLHFLGEKKISLWGLRDCAIRFWRGLLSRQSQ